MPTYGLLVPAEIHNARKPPPGRTGRPRLEGAVDEPVDVVQAEAQHGNGYAGSDEPEPDKDQREQAAPR
jgi:hypothetical protein